MSENALARRFPPELACVSQARGFVRGALSGRVPEATLDELVLVVSELVTNAILHVGAPVDLSVAADGPVRVEVVDGSIAPPTSRPVVPTDTGGRGLHLIDQICDRWGVDVLAEGKCVWCEVDPEMQERPQPALSGTNRFGA